MKPSLLVLSYFIVAPYVYGKSNKNDDMFSESLFPLTNIGSLFKWPDGLRPFYQLNKDKARPADAEYADYSDAFPESTVNQEFTEDLETLFFGNKQQQWWKGANVCVEREETDDSDTLENSEDTGFFKETSMGMQTCQQTRNVYECYSKEKSRGVSKTKTVRYQCCHGFQRRSDSDCLKVNLLSLAETIKHLDGSEFLKISADIDDILTKENVTVFLPTNKAFEEFTSQLLESDDVKLKDYSARRRRDVKGISPSQLLLGHMVAGFVDVSPDEIYKSLMDNSTLQVKQISNDGGEETLLVNCAIITSKDNHAINGIVHTIDRVLVPVSKDIMEIFKNNSQFSVLYNLLKTTGLGDNLKDDMWTIFAPTNAAFEKLDPRKMEKLKSGDSCVINILKHHMVAGSVCQANVQSGLKRTYSGTGESLRFSVPEKVLANDILTEISPIAFYVNKVKVTRPDIVATNGVIHAIDELLIPDSALPLATLLMKKNLTKFNEVIVKAGMQDEMENMSNVTLFIPIDRALEHFFDTDVQNPDDDITIEELRSFVLHHIIKGAMPTFDLINEEIKDTMDGNFPVRMNLYSTLPAFINTYNRATVDCARLVKFDTQQCSNVVHQIDKPLYRIEGTLLDHIAIDPEMSFLNAILPGTEVESILKSEKEITFVAPTNAAFEKIGANQEMLIQNKKLVDIILKNHILKDVICCTGLHFIPWPFTNRVRTYGETMLTLRNNKIGEAPLITCDIGATNGVMHYTNRLMVPTVIKNPSRNPNIDIQLFGL